MQSYDLPSRQFILVVYLCILPVIVVLIHTFVELTSSGCVFIHNWLPYRAWDNFETHFSVIVSTRLANCNINWRMISPPPSSASSPSAVVLSSPPPRRIFFHPRILIRVIGYALQNMRCTGRSLNRRTSLSLLPKKFISLATKITWLFIQCCGAARCTERCQILLNSETTLKENTSTPIPPAPHLSWLKCTISKWWLRLHRGTLPKAVSLVLDRGYESWVMASLAQLSSTGKDTWRIFCMSAELIHLAKELYNIGLQKV
jgi:hypothetical protein